MRVTEWFSGEARRFVVCLKGKGSSSGNMVRRPNNLRHSASTSSPRAVNAGSGATVPTKLHRTTSEPLTPSKRGIGSWQEFKQPLPVKPARLSIPDAPPTPAGGHPGKAVFSLLSNHPAVVSWKSEADGQKQRPLREGTTIVGSDPRHCDVVLEGTGVAKFHCEISVIGEQVILASLQGAPCWINK